MTTVRQPYQGSSFRNPNFVITYLLYTPYISLNSLDATVECGVEPMTNVRQPYQESTYKNLCFSLAP